MIDIGSEQRIYPAAKIAIVVDALAAEGVPVGDALRRTSLSPSDLRSPSTLVSVNQVIESYRNAIRFSHAPHFAFETGQKAHVSSYGMYGFAILSSMNFRETMHFAVKYHQLATPLVRLQFCEEAGSADWTIDPLPHPAIDPRLYRFIVELQFGVHVSLHRDVMGSAFYPSGVQVTFEAPEPEEQYREALGCTVAFGQPRNRFLYDAAWLNGAPNSATKSLMRRFSLFATTCTIDCKTGLALREKCAPICSRHWDGTRAWITPRRISASRCGRFVGSCATKGLRFAISSTSCAPRWPSNTCAIHR